MLKASLYSVRPIQTSLYIEKHKIKYFKPDLSSIAGIAQTNQQIDMIEYILLICQYERD